MPALALVSLRRDSRTHAPLSIVRIDVDVIAPIAADQLTDPCSLYHATSAPVAAS